jgi:hypothetical protein
MTIVIGLPQLEPIPGTRFKRLTKAFRVYSDTIKDWLEAPENFIYDEESTPWRGENPIAGLVHDLSSRIGVIKSKITAARIYLEFQYYEDSLIKRKWYTKFHDWIWRGIKSGFVAVCPAFFYWHKYKVEATYEEMG